MFESVRPKIPEVMAVDVGDLVLRDYRRVRESLSEADNDLIRGAWKRLQSHLDKLRPGTLVCERVQDVRERYDLAFMDARKTSPSPTREEFEKTYIPVVDDSELDPRLGSLTFVVYQDRRGVVGLFHLWNVEVLSKTERLWEISAYASPSLETSRGMMNADDIESSMRALLEHDMIFSETSGTHLDLVWWDFPTRADRAWVERPGEQTAAKLVIEMLSDHERTDKLSGGQMVPRRIKRKPARA